MIKEIALAFFAFIFVQSIQAQYPEDVPYQSIPMPTGVELPDFAESVTDYSVPGPMQITRVTEPFYYIDGNGNQQVWYPTHSYSKVQVWNADQTLFKIRAWKLYDATDYQEVQSLSGMYPAYWSNTNPDLLWSFRQNGDVKKHFVSTDVTQTVANIPGYELIQLGPGEGNIDKNDHYVALAGKKANGDMDVILFDLQTLQVVHTETFAGAWGNGGAGFPEFVDWVSVSQSGDYVVIMWNHNTTSGSNPHNGHYGVEVYNAADMQYLRRITGYGNHGDLGYAVDGDEVFVQFWGPTGTVNMYYLNRMERVVLSSHPDFNGEGHISCRNLNRPGWAYISQDYQDHSGQIIAMKLDTSGLVEHFGHHFSSAINYEKSPMPVPSPDGDKVFFKSDFATGPNIDPEEVYCFMATTKPVFNLSVFTEGSYNGTSLRTDLYDMGLMSVNQPFDTAPWNYDGQESLNVAAGTQVAAWVLVEFRQTDGDASTATPDKVIARQAALLLADGSIVQTDGQRPIDMDTDISDNLYVVVYQRNHLALMSSEALTKVGNTYSYDFTDALSKAYLGGQKDLGNGHFGMIGGDSNGDGVVNTEDMDNNWNTHSGKQGYYGSDLNADSQVDNKDKNDLWLPNAGLQTSVPE